MRSRWPAGNSGNNRTRIKPAFDELARLGIYPLSHKIELNERDRRFHVEGQIKDIVKACMADWDHKPLKNDISGRE